MRPTPLPQALVLTAIVIGFGSDAFAPCSLFQAYRAMASTYADATRPRASARPMLLSGTVKSDVTCTFFFAPGPARPGPVRRCGHGLPLGLAAAQRAVGMASLGPPVGASLALVAQAWRATASSPSSSGDWAAPFGITLRRRPALGAAMVAITGLLAFAVGVYALADIRRRQERAGFHPLFPVLIAGVTAPFLTGDIFNLYVWFEVMLIAVVGPARDQSRQGRSSTVR